jgi:ABC-type phosphate/phosphonate transport system ATPase subunit
VRNRWQRQDVELDDFWRQGTVIYKTVAIVDDPTVVLENVMTGEREHHVIKSMVFADFERLRPEDSA